MNKLAELASEDIDSTFITDAKLFLLIHYHYGDVTKDMSDEIDRAKENLTQADIEAVQFKIDKTIYELRNQDAFEGKTDQKIEVEQYKANKNWDRTLFQYSDVNEIVHHLIVDMDMRITPELKRGLYNNDCEYALSLIAKKELAIDLDQKLPVRQGINQKMKMKI